MSAINPTDTELTEWLAGCRSGDRLRVDLCSQNLIAYIAQLQHATAVLSAELVQLRADRRKLLELQETVTEAVANSLRMPPVQALAQPTATPVMRLLNIVAGAPDRNAEAKRAFDAAPRSGK